MNRNGGLAAGLLVVLTLFGVSTFSNRNSGGAGAADQARQVPSSARSVPPSGKPYSGCQEIAKRLQRFIAEGPPPTKTSKKKKKPLKTVAPKTVAPKTVAPKTVAPEDWSLPNSCYQQPPTASKPMQTLSGVRFIIATVPDPLTTHLSLMFDRIIETIQRAAQDDHYYYDSSWFPWEAADKTYPLLGDQLAADDLRDIQLSQPGVMVFRPDLVHDSDEPYHGGLVVFVVGEQPTGGISDEQFKNGLDWIAHFGALENPELRILGPTFSGSLASLRRVMERGLAPALERYPGHSKIFAFSGTVSSDSDFKLFDNWIKNRKDGSWFRTAMERDSLVVERFCRYLVQQSYEADKIAFLSEDETLFGTPGGCIPGISLHYPRDIATLRSAYGQQSIFTSAKPQASPDAPSTTLRGDLSEPSAGDHDTVRSYAGQLTPFAQEAVLLDVVSRLKEKQTQFIILRSTSSLDQIFLSEFLRRFYPEGRVVIDGADLLFNRGMEGRSLRGVMLLSTYPLLAVEQDWTSSLLPDQRAGSYRTFGDDTSEGVDIAARELFGSLPPTSDYAPPPWALGPHDDQTEDQLPPTWLSVIGHRQFWPLAVLNSNTLKTDQSKESEKYTGILLTSSALGESHPVNGDSGPLYLPTTAWMFLLASIAWGCFHLYFCWNGSITGSPRARAYFAPTPQWQHPALMALGSLLLATLAIIVAFGSDLFWWVTGPNPFRNSYTEPLVAGSVVLILGLSLAGCARNYALSPVRSSKRPPLSTARWHRGAFAVVIVALAAFILIRIHVIGHLSLANRIPVYWRNVNLLSGVAASVPEILLIAGGYLWFWCSLRGLAHFGDDRPRLPRRRDLPKLETGRSLMPMFSREGAGKPVERQARPLTLAYLIRLILILIATPLVCSVALHGFSVRTLGEREFGGVIFWSVCIFIAVILADVCQMWLLWNELRQLLINLDRLPLRRTLRALKGLAWGSIWKMSGDVLEERYRVISLQVESLRHLKNTMEVWLRDNPGEANDVSRSAMAKIVLCLYRLHTGLAQWYLAPDRNNADLTCLCDFQAELASIAGVVMTNILVKAWHGETGSLISARPGHDEGKNADAADGLNIPTDGIAPHVLAAEEFVVLPYLAFIQNILGRIRTIALGSLWLFVTATLAVSSYPFDPLNVLGGIFLTVFLISGGLLVLVYSQMSRDATLSHITNTSPGQLGGEFWVRLIGFGIGPSIGLLTTLFPAITDFAFSWLQPGVQALK